MTARDLPLGTRAPPKGPLLFLRSSENPASSAASSGALKWSKGGEALFFVCLLVFEGTRSTLSPASTCDLLGHRRLFCTIPSHQAQGLIFNKEDVLLV